MVSLFPQELELQLKLEIPSTNSPPFKGEAIVAEIIITNLTYIICRKNRENSMLTPKMTPILKIRYDQSELKSLFLGTSY